MFSVGTRDVSYLNKKGKPQASWSSGNALDMYCGGTQFESRPWYRIMWQTLSDFLQYIRANADGTWSRLHHDHFNPNAFKFIHRTDIRHFYLRSSKLSFLRICNNIESAIFDLNLYIYDHSIISTLRYVDLNLFIYNHTIISTLRYFDLNLFMYDHTITSTLRYLDLRLSIYWHAMISRSITPTYCFTTGPIRPSAVIRTEKEGVTVRMWRHSKW
jgi:hypothetical protein